MMSYQGKVFQELSESGIRSLRLVFVSCPLRGNKQEVEENLELARRYCARVLKAGHIPISPILIYPQFLDDTSLEGHNAGMNACFKLISKCDEIWFFPKPGQEISKGMAEELQFACNVNHTRDLEGKPRLNFRFCEGEEI